MCIVSFAAISMMYYYYYYYWIDGLYRLPNFLSKGGRDLIPEMLMNDPVKRITISEIRKGPWFQVNCPPYLSMPWEEYLQKNT